jgi:hypothetical protein
MAVFTAFELRGGWIQGLGRIYCTEIPSKGESVQIASVNMEPVRWYEVLDVELTRDPASAGNIVLSLKSSNASDVATREGDFSWRSSTTHTLMAELPGNRGQQT